MLADTTNSKYAKVHALEFGTVKWTGGIWKDAVDTCAKSTVPQLKHMFDDKNISHIVENFKICAGEAEGTHDGTVFGDGDFYKWMEAAVYSAVKDKNTALLNELDAYIELIGRAQQPDGYISTKQIIGERMANGVSRLGDINDFEVYNFGHLFTSACIYFRVTGKDNFLRIAEKAAGYLKRLYAEAEKKGEVKTAVCPSHYMGLIELYRTTGKKQYLQLAEDAVRLRDSVKNGLDDNQDRLPLKKHRKIIGHAVRANYLYAGVADLYAEKGDGEYLEVLHSVWEDLQKHKIYLNGGCGALYNGASPYGNFFVHQLVHQAYGYDYQLPNITAYAETCASIGYVMWAYRMFLIEPKAEYFDAIENAMLNVNMAAVSLDGRKFFYENMMRRTAKLNYELVWPLTRTEYITSYCCPPNLARTMAESAEYAYTVKGNQLWTGLYGDSEAKIKFDNDTVVLIRQQTHYPYDGKIVFDFERLSGNGKIVLNIRIPGWVESGSIKPQTGRTEKIGKKKAETYIGIEIDPDSGRSVTVNLDMPVRLITANQMVEEDTNQAAVMRGPLLYCMESADTGGKELGRIMLGVDTELCPEECSIQRHRLTALSGEAWYLKLREHDEQKLYERLKVNGVKRVRIRMIPYYAWDNRGFGEMKVFLPLRY
ncbi:MAG: glycoside hydrolase family 127 protein [Butyrivibrio sp.]|jgi:DUF1680 family protein|nr:glycoside hydrolase family 127 protein [Butyrivibrio sp.]